MHLAYNGLLNLTSVVTFPLAFQRVIMKEKENQEVPINAG